MGLLSALRGDTNRENSKLFECRDCGKSLEPEADECPACDSTEIAIYTL